MPDAGDAARGEQERGGAAAKGCESAGERTPTRFRTALQAGLHDRARRAACPRWLGKDETRSRASAHPESRRSSRWHTRCAREGLHDDGGAGRRCGGERAVLGSHASVSTPSTCAAGRGARAACGRQGRGVLPAQPAAPRPGVARTQASGTGGRGLPADRPARPRGKRRGLRRDCTVATSPYLGSAAGSASVCDAVARPAPSAVPVPVALTRRLPARAVPDCARRKASRRRGARPLPWRPPKRRRTSGRGNACTCCGVSFDRRIGRSSGSMREAGPCRRTGGRSTGGPRLAARSDGSQCARYCDDLVCRSSGISTRSLRSLARMSQAVR